MTAFPTRRHLLSFAAAALAACLGAGAAHAQPEQPATLPAVQVLGPGATATGPRSMNSSMSPGRSTPPSWPSKNRSIT